jgi:hypothetical protein
MSRFEPNLRIPGPTALPPSVREAGGRQMVNHRGEEFKALLLRVSEGMKPFFGTSADVIMLTCAGTGGLEAAIVNTLSPGDPVLAVTWARSATGSPRSPRSTAPPSPASTSNGARRRRPPRCVEPRPASPA